MAGDWNAHSDREGEDDFDSQDEAEEAARQLREEIDGLKATIRSLAADVDAATKWAAAYEREHGPFKALPPIPDFMIPF